MRKHTAKWAGGEGFVLAPLSLGYTFLVLHVGQVLFWLLVRPKDSLEIWVTYVSKRIVLIDQLID
jgi:hypothetical protein